MKYTFFWKSKFSQWSPVVFKDNTQTYNCCEQYMMYQKAILFGDQETAEKIMQTSSPKEQQELGRRVKKFDQNVWNQNCRNIVYKANRLRYRQDETSKELLKQTIGTLMVEASPYDKIWGVGLSKDDPLIQDPKNWLGTNYLGRCLTAVRRDLFRNPIDIELFSDVVGDDLEQKRQERIILENLDREFEV